MQGVLHERDGRIQGLRDALTPQLFNRVPDLMAKVEPEVVGSIELDRVLGRARVLRVIQIELIACEDRYQNIDQKSKLEGTKVSSFSLQHAGKQNMKTQTSKFLSIVAQEAFTKIS